MRDMLRTVHSQMGYCIGLASVRMLLPKLEKTSENWLHVFFCC